MTKIIRTLGNVWDSICDHSDFAEHVDSVVRWKYIQPVREAIRNLREALKAMQYSDGAF